MICPGLHLPVGARPHADRVIRHLDSRPEPDLLVLRDVLCKPALASLTQGGPRVVLEPPSLSSDGGGRTGRVLLRLLNSFRWGRAANLMTSSISSFDQEGRAGTGLDMDASPAGQ